MYPLDTAELPAGPNQMGDVFNVMAYAAVTDRLCVVMFTHAHTPAILMVAALLHASHAAMLYRACHTRDSSSAPSRWATINLSSSG